MRFLVPLAFAVLFGLLAILPIWNSSSSGIELSFSEHRFGEVGCFATPTKILQIRNPQASEMSLHIEADCSCVDLSHSAATLPPGAVLDVVISMKRNDSGHLSGDTRSVSQNVNLLYSHEGARKVEVVNVSAAFLEPLAIDKSACLYEAFPLAEAGHGIALRGNVPVHSVEVVSAPEFCKDIVVHWDDRNNLGRLHLQLDALIGPQGWSDSIQLRVAYTLAGKTKELPVDVPFTVEFRDPVIVDPPMAVLGSEVGGGKMHYVSVRDECKTFAQAKILGIKSMPRGVSAEIRGGVERDELAIAWRGVKQNDSVDLPASDSDEAIVVSVSLSGHDANFVYDRSIPCVWFK